MSVTDTAYKMMSSTERRSLSKDVKDLKAKAHKWYVSGAGQFDRFIAHQDHQRYVWQDLFGTELRKVENGDEALVTAGYILIKFGIIGKSHTSLPK